jgi:hypothetical protein
MVLAATRSATRLQHATGMAAAPLQDNVSVWVPSMVKGVPYTVMVL